MAFSLVAGFAVTHTGSCINPNATQSGSFNVTIQTSYPFGNALLTTSNNTHGKNIELNGGYVQTAQFFVTWGVFTLFYGIIALAVYILTTANSSMEWLVNYLVLAVSVGEEEERGMRGGGGVLCEGHISEKVFVAFWVTIRNLKELVSI